MNTAPGHLIDIATRHAVYLERLKVENAKPLLGFLDKFGRTVRAQLLEAGEITAFSKKRLRALVESIDAELESRALEMHGVFRQQIVELGIYEAEFEITALSQIVKWDFNTPSPKQLESAVWASPMTEIRGPNGGALLNDFLDSWKDSAIKTVRGSILSGYYKGDTTPAIVRRVIGTPGLNYGDGDLRKLRRDLTAVVHTSIHHAANTARNATWNENRDVVEAVEIVATLDSRTSPICRSLDGKVFPVDSGPRPPFHVRCRTTTCAVLSPDLQFLEEGGTRAARNPETGKVSKTSAGTTYYEWLSKQPAKVQDSIIGPTRGALLRDGGLTVKRFSDLQLGKNFDPLTLAQMKELEPIAFQRAGLAE